MSQNNDNHAETIQLDSNDTAVIANPFAPSGGNSGPPAVNDVGNIAQNESSESSSSDTTLVRLNDDCWIKVFEYLPLSDLCHVADVCRVFEASAISVFRRRHSHLDLDNLLCASDKCDEYDSEYDSYTEYESDSEDESVNDERYKLHREPLRLLDMKTVEKLFLHFGAHIQSFQFHLDDEDQRDKILEMLATYCTHEDTELNKLKMSDVTIGPELIPRIQPLFDRVKVLDITGGAFSTVYFGAELIELILEDIHLELDLDSTLPRKFENLQTLSLIDVDCDSKPIGSLLDLFPHVKRLTITSRSLEFWWKDIRLSSELEELELNLLLEPGELDDYDYLARLQHLKIFKLNCDTWIAMTKLLNSFVEHNVPIEELSFSNFTLDVYAAKSLTGLSKIKKLSLCDGEWHEMVQLANVIKELPNLEELYLINFGCVTIDNIKATIENAPKLNKFVVHFLDKGMEFKIRTKDYYEICQLIQKRSDMTKLKLELTGNGIKFSVPEYIVKRSQSWLEVMIVTFKDVENIDVIDYYGFSAFDDYNFSDESESSDGSDSSDRSESGEE